ncbi:hypothetical protein GGTG_03790 [Gaeumannomyces tritici R3-111a-1]|uniref:Uncharacterized protein n=1 Tax=Gaeumannomyces tritici (strain R3-111a-1) TaxID=644352 RepID=J3NR85_GAET3|nr:hypothetical protein GGTG_03790 [Gaeumannomyces tritici R3-111a-1]EJT78691.1 hypothetical protein GGTG_03790 [Gaeumannomyces tritici R3-111a-1]
MSDQAALDPHLEPDLLESGPHESSPKIPTLAEELLAETSTPEVSPTSPEELQLSSDSSDELPRPTSPNYARKPSISAPLASPVRSPSRHRVNSRAVRNIVFRNKSSSPTKPGIPNKSAVSSIRSNRLKHKTPHGEEVFFGVSFSSDDAAEPPALSLREIRFPRGGRTDIDPNAQGRADGPDGYFFTDPGKPTLTNTANFCALGDSSDLGEDGYELSDDGSTIRSLDSQENCQQSSEHPTGNQPAHSPSGTRPSNPKDSSRTPFSHTDLEDFAEAPWAHYLETLSSFRALSVDIIVASYVIVSTLGASTAKNLYATVRFDCRLIWALISIWVDFFCTILQAIHLSLWLWLGYLSLCCLKRLPENVIGELAIDRAAALDRAWRKLCHWATLSNSAVFTRPVSTVVSYLWQVVPRCLAHLGPFRWTTGAKPDFQGSQAEDETSGSSQSPTIPHQSHQQISARELPEKAKASAQKPAQLAAHHGSPKKAAQHRKQSPVVKSPRHMSTGAAITEMRKGLWSPLDQKRHVGFAPVGPVLYNGKLVSPEPSIAVSLTTAYPVQPTYQPRKASKLHESVQPSDSETDAPAASTLRIPRSRTLTVLSNISHSLSRASLGSFASNRNVSNSSTSTIPMCRDGPEQSRHAQARASLPRVVGRKSLESQADSGPVAPPTLNHRLVTTAMPDSYWAGRFLGLHDRFHSELLGPNNLEIMVNAHASLSALPNQDGTGEQKLAHRAACMKPSATSSDIVHRPRAISGSKKAQTRDAERLEDEDNRSRRVFLHLETMCITREARGSLQAFQQEYARKMKRPGLLPQGGSMEDRGFISRLISGGKVAPAKVTVTVSKTNTAETPKTGGLGKQLSYLYAAAPY